MIDIYKGAKELITKIEELADADEKLKSKHIKALKIIIKDCEAGNEMLVRMMKSEIYIEASLFVDNKGKEDYTSRTMSVTKSELINLFVEFKDTFTDEEYWENLRDAYILQDYEKSNLNLLTELFSTPRKERHNLMTSEEIIFFNSLSNSVHIFRGGAESEVSDGHGISWTLNKEVADKFARNKALQTGLPMMTHEKVVSKENIIAYFNSRKEEEIIYLG